MNPNSDLRLPSKAPLSSYFFDTFMQGEQGVEHALLEDACSTSVKIALQQRCLTVFDYNDVET